MVHVWPSPNTFWKGPIITRHSAPDRVAALTRGLLRLPVCPIRIDALPGTGRRRLLEALCAARREARLAVPGESCGAGVMVIGNRDLFLGPGDDVEFARSGGWPGLSEALRRTPRDEALAAMTLRALLSDLPDEQRSLLGELQQAKAGLADIGLGPSLRAALHWLDPLVEYRAGLWQLRTEGLRHLIGLALGRPARQALPAPVSPVAKIAGLQDHGQRAAALALFRQAGGGLLMHLHGVAAARQIADVFGDDPDPDLVAQAFFLAAKRGDIRRAAYLLARSGHEALTDLDRPLANPDQVPPALGFCRIMLAIYHENSLPERFLGEGAALLRRVHPRQALLRGAIYNAMLELHIRRRRFAEAQEIARRALRHYRAANAPYLQFFIHLHEAVIQLFIGAAGPAGRHLDSAERALAQIAFAAPQDRRFLEVLRNITAYHDGDALPLVRFIETQMDDFAYGELWPSIAEITLTRGAEALLQLRGLPAALEFTDRWRVQAWRTQRFETVIGQCRVSVLQGGRRWREARLLLEAMARPGRDLAAPGAPEEIAQALLWLRQQAFETPRDAELPGRMTALMGNPALSAGQLLRLRIWRVWVDRRQGRIGPARRALASALGDGAARHMGGLLLQERVFILPLLDDRRMMRGDLTGAPLPRHLRRGALMAIGTGPLSRQEWRALMLLAEGCRNKDIARDMALSLPTVKLHLSNLYRKLEVADRRAAVAEARRRGLLG